MSGVILGGWEYVWAAYGVTAIAFGVYGISLVRRLNDARGKMK